MKKVLLCLFLIASMTVNSKIVANSLSPPKSFDVKFVPQLSTLQLVCETTPLLSAVLFECDVSCNLSVLTNQKNARTSFGTSDALKNEAISPPRDKPFTSDVFQSVSARNSVDVKQAVSPNCRDVIFMLA